MKTQHLIGFVLAVTLPLACQAEVHTPAAPADAIVEELGGPSGGDTALDSGRSADAADVAGADAVASDASADGAVGPPAPAHWDDYCTKALFADFEPELSDPNCFEPSALFDCSAEAEPASLPARVRRITRTEMVRAAGMKLASDLGRNPFEPPPHLSYPTYDRGVTIDVVTLDLYLNVLHLPGKGWTNDLDPRISYTFVYGGGGGPPVDGCIWDDAEPDAACRALWVSNFLEGGLLFRPPTADETMFIAGLLDDALAKEASTGATRQETMSFVVSAAWLSPEALFRTEFGEETPDAAGRHRLTDAELGKQVAYILTDRGPGAPATHTSTGGWHTGWSNATQGDRVPYLMDIRSAVADGAVQDSAVIERLVRDNVGGQDTARPDLHVDYSISKTTKRGAWFLAPRVRDFFREWLGYLPAQSAYKDTPAATSRFTADDFDTALWDYIDNPNSDAVTGGYNGNLSNSAGDDEATLIQQMDDFIARVVLGDEDVFRALLTSRLYRVPSSRPGGPCTSSTDCDSKCLDGRCYGSTWTSHRYSALVYDLPGHIEADVTPADHASGSRWVEMAQGDRAGVLTHPAWLAAHGDNFEDGQSAIHRGRWVREKLLCEHVPPLSKVPPGVEIMLPDSHPDLSARDRILMATDNAFCGACHVRMNSLGLAFEQYNHAGFLRGWDHDTDPQISQGPVDSSTQLEGAGSDGAVPDPALQGQAYGSAVELVTALADSEVTKRCFVRQAFRFFAGRDERLADACTLSQMEQAYDQKGSFIDMLVALAQSDTMLYRARPESPETQTCP